MKKIKSNRKGRIRAFLLGTTVSFVACISVLTIAPLPKEEIVKTEYIVIEDDGCFVRDGKNEYKLKRLTLDDIKGMIK